MSYFGNAPRPFRVGDWVKIGTLEEGIVTDVNWRATRIFEKINEWAAVYWIVFGIENYQDRYDILLKSLASYLGASQSSRYYGCDSTT